MGSKGMTMTLRYSFAGAVALTVLATAAGAADMQPVLKAPGAQPEQQATGYVEIYSGWGSTKNTACFDNRGCDTLKGNGWALGGAGRGNYWITRDVSVQVDAQAEGSSYTSSDQTATSRPIAIWSAATGAGAIRSNTCSACSRRPATPAAASGLRGQRVTG